MSQSPEIRWYITDLHHSDVDNLWKKLANATNDLSKEHQYASPQPIRTMLGDNANHLESSPSFTRPETEDRKVSGVCALVGGPSVHVNKSHLILSAATFGIECHVADHGKKRYFLCIDVMQTHPSEQKKGYGRILADASKAVAERHGIHELRAVAVQDESEGAQLVPSHARLN
jgi:GNAT superfamily N-acetyltransferase